MLTKCSHCGEIAVDDTENEEVCHACGIVSQDTKLSNAEYTPFSSHTPFIPFSRFEARIRNVKKQPTCLLHGLSVLDQLCHRNNINANLKADITDLFTNVCSKRNFNNREDAGALAACCMFLVQRNNKQAVPIKIICNQVGCTRGKFSYYLSYLKSYLFNLKKGQNSIDALSSVYMKKEEKFEDVLSDTLSSLIREVCNKAEKEEKSKLMKKVTALVKLAEDCWLLTGRSPRSVVVASAYLCWKSMSPLRKKASYPKFCSTFEIHEPIAKQRIPELRACLLKLGQKIPSYTTDLVTEDNLLFHLDTILENSVSLRNDLLTDIHESEAINCKEYETFRFPVQNQPRKEPSCPVIYEPNMNASDIEISDTEIEMYIIPDSKRKIIALFEKKDELCVKKEK